MTSLLARADLVPEFCEGIELSWHDENAFTHCFAVPSSTFPGLWHVGCARARCLRRIDS